MGTNQKWLQTTVTLLTDTKLAAKFHHLQSPAALHFTAHTISCSLHCLHFTFFGIGGRMSFISWITSISINQLLKKKKESRRKSLCSPATEKKNKIPLTLKGSRWKEGHRSQERGRRWISLMRVISASRGGQCRRQDVIQWGDMRSFLT